MSRKITLPGHEVEWLLRGALAAASKDDVTPILTAVLWDVEADRVTVTATDRYRVHQLHTKGDFSGAEGQFLMNRAQAELLLKSWHTPRRLYRDQVVELSWTDAETLPPGTTGKIARKYLGTCQFTIYAWRDTDADRITHEGAQVRGNFPPIGRLFPDETDPELREAERVGTVMLDPTLLADTRWLRSGHGALRFVLPRAKNSDGQHMKAGPVLVVNTEGTARGLIQPNLALASGKRYGDG